MAPNLSCSVSPSTLLPATSCVQKTVDLKLGRLDSCPQSHHPSSQLSRFEAPDLVFCDFFRMFSKFAACKNMDRPLVQHKKSTNQYTLIVPRFIHLLDASYQLKKIHVLSSLTVILTPYSPWNKSSGVFENSVPSCPSEHQRSCMLLS